VAKGYPIGVQVVHDYLFSLCDRRGVTKVDHADLMEEFQCTKTTASRLVRALTEQGRIVQVSKRKQRKGFFVVKDPATFVSGGVSENETERE
jgi:DNA-binding transcriptional regulator GbsR (MarR family)